MWVGEGRHRWGWGQLEPEPGQCWGAGGKLPSFIDSLFQFCCKLPEAASDSSHHLSSPDLPVLSACFS